MTDEGRKLRYDMKENTCERFYLPKNPKKQHNLLEKQPQKAMKLKSILLKECGNDLQNDINRAG